MGDFRLDRRDFRDRARSIRISYESGALAPYIKRAAPAVAKIQPLEPQATAQTGTTAPETVQAQAPVPEAVQPVADEPKSVQPETTPAVTAAPEPPATAPAKAQITELPPAPSKIPAAQTPAKPADVQLALPKLEPKIVPQVRKDMTPAMATQTFQFPVHEIYRLNYCPQMGQGLR